MLYPDFGGHRKGARLRKDLDLNADLEREAKTLIPSAQYDRPHCQLFFGMSLINDILVWVC